MPFYEIKWTKFGTALIEAEDEDQAFEYLSYEDTYDEVEVESIKEERPSCISLYDPVSLG